jgi:uridine phosphorylase
MSLNELPGAELILSGLDDLHNGQPNTVGSLLVAIAATRLAGAGLDVPKDHLAAEPELTLYARLQDERDDAYPYYNALLNSLNSFCNALEFHYYKHKLSHQVAHLGDHKMMTELLEKAIARLKTLPTDKQDAIASLILEELEDDQIWDESFARSPDLLAKLAAEAMAEYRAGKTHELDPETL